MLLNVVLYQKSHLLRYLCGPCFKLFHSTGLVQSLMVLLFQTEIILTKTSQGGKTTANTSTLLPKMPPNPTRIDHLIVNQMKEQAKVGHGPTLPSPDKFLYNNIDMQIK